MPMVPTFFRSVIDAIPCTITQKITGAIIMRISETNESPSGFSAVPVFGKNPPVRQPTTTAINTWMYSTVYQGLAFRFMAAFPTVRSRPEKPCGTAIAGCAVKPPALNFAQARVPVLGHYVSRCLLPGEESFHIAPCGAAEERR